MLKLYSDSLIYVHAPGDYSTGGVELLHQLVDSLRNNGRDAYIVYYGNKTTAITESYTRYNIKIKQNNEIVDSNHNVEVYTETNAKSLKRNTRQTQKMLWWLSVDNYYVSNENHLGFFDMLLWNRTLAWNMFKHRTKMILKCQSNDFFGNVSLLDFAFKGHLFGFQCEYIKKFLRKFGIFNSVKLSDYINLDFVDNMVTSRKENLVLYNPTKGLEFTKHLIDYAPDIEWVPLKGYNREQLLNIIGRAKIYIDFGNHPGKDRLPRECAMGDCCIITGKRGSAAYSDDLPIPEEYKFNDSVMRVGEVIKKIRETLENYEFAIGDFAKYREIIRSEKIIFEAEVKRIFNC